MPFDIDLCESPIEELFAYNVCKYLSEDSQLKPQVSIPTLCGSFRLDFMISNISGLNIGVECDGKDFHDARRDEWRDAMILGDNSDIQGILRFRGVDIKYRINDLLFLTSKIYPLLFSERGKANLKILASNEVKRDVFSSTETFLRVRYSDGENENHCLLVEHRHKNIPKGKRQFWQAAYSFAKSNGGGDIDSIVSNYNVGKL